MSEKRYKAPSGKSYDKVLDDKGEDIVTQTLKAQQPTYKGVFKAYKDKPKSRPVSSGDEWTRGLHLLIEFAEFNKIKWSAKGKGLIDDWTDEQVQSAGDYLVENGINLEAVSSPQ